MGAAVTLGSSEVWAVTKALHQAMGWIAGQYGWTSDDGPVTDWVRTYDRGSDQPIAQTLIDLTEAAALLEAQP